MSEPCEVFNVNHALARAERQDVSIKIVILSCRLLTPIFILENYFELSYNLQCLELKISVQLNLPKRQDNFLLKNKTNTNKSFFFHLPLAYFLNNLFPSKQPELVTQV